MSLKEKVKKIVSSAAKRIKREKDADRKYRLKIIHEELSKLADQL